jgi:tagatose-1,6-bisphosphate aldolase non-catalytic subunit AgaZ/GatZ
LDLGNPGPSFSGPASAIQERSFRFEKDATKRGAKRVNSLSVNASTFQADNVQSPENGMVTGRHAVRNYVGVHSGNSTDHRSASDPAILLNRRKAAQYHALADMDMACQRCAVGKIGVVLDYTVVTDVAVCHEVSVVADSCYAAAAAASATHRNALANDAVRADYQTSIIIVVTPNLSFAAQNCLWVHDSSGADLRATPHYHMR